MDRSRVASLLLVVSALFGFSTTANAAPGDVISIEATDSFTPAGVDAEIAELFEGHTAPTARHAVDVYLIHYESTYPDGSPAAIRAQLLVPRGGSQAGPRPSNPRSGARRASNTATRASRDLYLFGPGSTGIRDACSPSREHILGIHWGLYRAHMLAYSGQGFVGLLPDYMGMGDPERYQPFFHADAGAYLMLDGIRAAENALQEIAAEPFRRVFLGGFSQGGHAAFAAADFRLAYAPDVQIDGIIGYGPTTDMFALIQEFVVAAPIVAYSYRERYGKDRFDPAVMFQARWVETLDHDVTRQCIGGIQRYYPWNPAQLFRPEFLAALREDTVASISPEIDTILRENSVGLSGHGVPALIVQGTDDIVVYPPSQTQFVVDLRESGSDVRYYIYENERHDVRQAAYFDVLAWIEEQQ
jgi:predicted esterase